MPTYTTYTAKSRSITCESTSSKHDQHTACDVVKLIATHAGYNDSRMSKLQNEFKCAPGYEQYYRHGGEAKDSKPMPECYKSVYSSLATKLNTAAQEVSKLDAKLNNIDAVCAYAGTVKNALVDLQSFTVQNKQEANKAFELALYDTNAMGVLGALSVFAFGPFGLLGALANAGFNNEFDGKIGRAVEEINDLLTNCAELSHVAWY